MAISHLRLPNRRRTTTTPYQLPTFLHSPPKNPNIIPIAILRTHRNSKWSVNNVLRIRAEEQIPPKLESHSELVDFLYKDLLRLFDDQDIDQMAYDEHVKFRDPVTKHDSIDGYLSNIAMLRKLFSPKCQLHGVKQTGPYEITTRWTVVMKYALLPWKPELVFTGTSVMGINPETKKFCSHVDYWDAIENNDYFSVEGLLEVAKQLLRYYKTPDFETPKYQVLKRTANYEMPPFFFLDAKVIVVETNGDKLSDLTGFNSVVGYIFGKNSMEEKIPMAMPLFTQTSDPDEKSTVSIQIVLPSEIYISSLPVREVEGGVAAVCKFSRKPNVDIVMQKETALRSNLIKDGLKPKAGCVLVCYNDPRMPWSFTMV